MLKNGKKRSWRHKTGVQQPMLKQLRNPLTVLHVGLPVGLQYTHAPDTFSSFLGAAKAA